MNFLCVDDSATLRKLVAITLSSSGHTVTEAENGRVGLDRLASAKIDCVILDINMPEMGGLEFLAAKRAVPAYAGIPVIVLTTEAEEALRSKAMGLGANGFLAKPFQKTDLQATIHQILGV
jgi:two-component system, chemotaxis family, chemotaxis protein CheY